jgi:long-chain acyl-CoA synthetase
MLDPTQYESLGAALTAALDRWPDEVCLIEADRDRERCRLTYRDFANAARAFGAALEESGFAAGDRAAIVMTNQSKWLISAYAVFYAGGVLVPLDYKLSPQEHLALLAHSKASVLIIEYPLWRAIIATLPAGGSTECAGRHAETVLVTEAPAGAELAEGKRWEEFHGKNAANFHPRKRSDTACIVYSSGTGGDPKGCVLTHGNYLEQCRSLSAFYPFAPGVRYLSILPTNHAIDFMVGFIRPFLSGATVVHLRTLRPEYVREAFTRYRITYMALVPLVLKNLEKGLRTRFAELPPVKRAAFQALKTINRTATRHRPKLWLSRALLPQVHKAFGGELRALCVGGAFTEPATLQFFNDLGIQVVNGYGLTEAGTAVTLGGFMPYRPDTVGKPLPGVELRIVNPGADGVGEVAVRGQTVMSHYLDDPEMTAETIVDGWLMTGDLGLLDATGHLRLVGRKKNMIVTAEGKNIYPEDIENVFEGLGVKEFCVFAANYLWPERTMSGEQLIMILHPEPGQDMTDAIRGDVATRNQRLVPYKRVSGYLVWEKDFPRTASLKIKRGALAQEIRPEIQRDAVVAL